VYGGQVLPHGRVDPRDPFDLVAQAVRNLLRGLENLVLDRDRAGLLQGLISALSSPNVLEGFKILVLE
jgi:hypothetical protein